MKTRDMNRTAFELFVPRGGGKVRLLVGLFVHDEPLFSSTGVWEYLIWWLAQGRGSSVMYRRSTGP